MLSSRPNLGQNRLEAHLWAAANLLRGKIDSADFKSYIFALLFYKRLSDVWEEEQRAAADSAHHRFHVPAAALWPNVARHRSNLGRHLDVALRLVEDANPRLEGLFREVSFVHRDRFPDTTLKLLLRHFEIHRLGNADVEPDVLGNAYQYLIAQFADDAGKKGGEFYTPRQVARLLAECLEPQAGMTVYDPCCGSGGLLLEVAGHLARRGQDPGSLELCGQEMNVNTWAICRINLLLHGIHNSSVERGDTLRHPRHLDGGGNRVRQFDRVLSNPPFSLKNWGYEEWSVGDAFGRDPYGTPPRRYGDLAFVQHMLASLGPDGRAGVVVPHGVLFRGGAEQRIRRAMIRDDWIEAVIGLAPSLFYGTTVSTCLLVLRRRKPPERRGRILFVDGSAEHEKRKGRAFLTDAHVARLASCFQRFQDEEGLARVVELDEVHHDGDCLSIARYVRRPEITTRTDVAAEVRRLLDLKRRRSAAETKMLDLLDELGLKD